jgi:hypothetical protein
MWVLPWAHSQEKPVRRAANNDSGLQMSPKDHDSKIQIGMRMFADCWLDPAVAGGYGSGTVRIARPDPEATLFAPANTAHPVAIRRPRG